LESLRKKYIEEKGVVSREIKVVQRSKNSLVLHIYYRIPIYTEPLKVIFDCKQPNIFTYEKSNYQIANIQGSNIPSILL
jgi:hypothetical protein